MKKWVFVVSMTKQQSDQAAGWVGVCRDEGGWKTCWCNANALNREDLAMYDGEVTYFGNSLEQAKVSCLELIRQKESEGYSLTFPIRLVPKSSGPSYTVLDCYSDLNCNLECYEELRQWRLKKAQEKNMSVFIIATNRLLKQIAAFLPHTQGEIMQLSGMGNSKWNQFGQELLKITHKYDRNTEFPLHWVYERVTEQDFAGWKEQQLLSKENRKQDLEEKALRNKKAILESIHEQAVLEAICTKLNQSVSSVLKHVEELREEGYDILPWIEQQVERFAELPELLAATEELGTKYAKPVFQKLYPHVPNEQASEKYDQIRAVFVYVRSLNEQRERVAAVS